MKLKRILISLIFVGILMMMNACQSNDQTETSQQTNTAELAILGHLEKSYFGLDIFYQVQTDYNRNINRIDHLVLFNDPFLKAYVLNDSKEILYRYVEQGEQPYFVYEVGSSMVLSTGIPMIRKFWTFDHVIFELMKNATFTKMENDLKYYNISYKVSDFDETNSHLLYFIDDALDQDYPVDADMSEVELHFELQTTRVGDLVYIMIDVCDYMSRKFPMTIGPINITYQSAGIMFSFLDDTYDKDINPITSFVIDDYPNYLNDNLPSFILNQSVPVNHEFEHDVDLFELIITETTTLTLSNPDEILSQITITKYGEKFSMSLNSQSVTLEPGTYILSIRELLGLGLRNILITTS